MSRSWTYSQRIFARGQTGLLALTNTGQSWECYSGHGDGLNNPLLEAVADVGPIPEGKWFIEAVINTDPATNPFANPSPDRIGNWLSSEAHLGPWVWILSWVSQADGNPAWLFPQRDRKSFRVHGDSSAQDHTASEGCIVAPLAARMLIHDGDSLTVSP